MLKSIGPGKFYLKTDGIFVRQVLAIMGSEVAWQGFGADDGSPVGRGICSIGTLMTWAERELTPEEAAKMNTAQAVAKFEDDQAAMVASLPTQVLLRELRKRGYEANLKILETDPE